MSTKAARDFARKGRKSAPEDMYDFARNFERAIDALASEIERLRSGAPKPVAEKGPTRRRDAFQ